MTSRPLSILSFLFVTVLLLTLPFFATAQTGRTSPKHENTKATRQEPDRRMIGSVGPGFGLDYGGIGLRAEFLPFKHLGIFAGGGFNFDQLGYNFGLAGRLTPDKRTSFVLTAMYGYNGVLIVKGAYNNDVHKQTYYGISAGAGVEFAAGKIPTNRFSLKILIPFRSNEFIEDAAAVDADPLPFAISAGFNLGF